MIKTIKSEEYTEKQMDIYIITKCGITDEGHLVEAENLLVTVTAKNAFDFCRSYVQKINYKGFAEVEEWDLSKGKCHKIWRYNVEKDDFDLLHHQF
jgi:hypothetical protein